MHTVNDLCPPFPEDRNVEHWTGARPDQANEELSDAELYRILVADAIRHGRALNKSVFDEKVKQISTLRVADDFIAFYKRRPNCLAWRHGLKMICECGNVWSAADPDGPACGL